jgi:hypothetical protein
MVTDTGTGNIDFWDLQENRVVDSCFFPARQASPMPVTAVPQGCMRNETRVCHHPVFSRDGSQVLFNAFNGDLSELVEVKSPGGK